MIELPIDANKNRESRTAIVKLLLSTLATFGAARFVQDGGGGAWISGG